MLSINTHLVKNLPHSQSQSIQCDILKIIEHENSTSKYKKVSFFSTKWQTIVKTLHLHIRILSLTLFLLLAHYLITTSSEKNDCKYFESLLFHWGLEGIVFFITHFFLSIFSSLYNAVPYCPQELNLASDKNTDECTTTYVRMVFWSSDKFFLLLFIYKNTCSWKLSARKISYKDTHKWRRLDLWEVWI